jgi:HlyD family secretion protein
MDVVKAPKLVSAMDQPLRKKRKLPRLAIVGAAALLVAAGIGWVILTPSDRTLRVEADKITIATVTTAPFHDFIPLRGQIVPLDSVVLDAVQGGRVEEVLAEAGQRVTAGQILLRFSDPTLELEAIAREAQVIEQINQQRTLELSFEQTRTNDAKAVNDADYNILRLGRQVARRQPLAIKGYESQETLDISADELAYQKRLKDIALDAQKRDAALIEKSVALIHETAARLDDNLAAAKRQVETLLVRAPTDGVLTALDAHVGEQKNRGQNLGQVDRDGGSKVTVQVDEFYLARVRPGQPVTVTIDGQPATLAVAKVYPQVKDGKFDVDLAWNGEQPAGLRRGQAVQGKLELGGDVPATVLPAGPFLEASGGAWAFVVEHDGGSALRRPVKLGRRTVESVEVLSGLVPGDHVVTSDYTGLDRIDRLAISH